MALVKESIALAFLLFAFIAGSHAADSKFSCTVDRVNGTSDFSSRSSDAKNVTCSADANNTCVLSHVIEDGVSSIIRNCFNSSLKQETNKDANKTLNNSPSNVNVRYCNMSNCNWNYTSSEFKNSMIDLPTINVSTPAPNKNFTCWADRVNNSTNFSVVKSATAKQVICNADAAETCVVGRIEAQGVSMIIRNCSNATLNSKNDYIKFYKEILNVNVSMAEVRFCYKENCNDETGEFKKFIVIYDKAIANIPQTNNGHHHEHHHETSEKPTAATPVEIPPYFVISVLGLLGITFLVSSVVLIMVCKRGGSEES